VADETRVTSEATDTVDETSAAGKPAGETSATVAEKPGETSETAAPVAEKPGETSEAAVPVAEKPGETSEAAVPVAEKPGETSEAGEPTDESATSSETTGAGGRASRARLAAIVLGAATVVLGGFGVWATLEAHSLRANAAPQNIAVTDGAATSAVNRQIVSAVNTVFSYNYADTAATRQAAQGLLTGPAIRQYDTYFALVAKDAPAQKLVVTTRVTNSGVELLDGNQARVLVFANQQDTRAGTHQTSYAGALFAVTAVRQGGRWKIENIDTFNGQQ
jgi:Mce-associated membrane protein